MTHSSRRNFIKRSLALPAAYTASRVGGVSLVNIAAASLGVGKANAAVCDTGPRSLICLFLAGGADTFNFIVPTGNRYDEYAQTRNDMAVSESNLIEVTDAQQGSFGFNSALPIFQSMYQQNELAVVSNVGPLLKPTSQSDFTNELALPESLFAHNTQQKLWQTAAGQVSGSGAFGWGGATGVQVSECNASASVPGLMSIAGANAWQTSRDGNYIALSPNADIQRMYGFDPGIATWIPEASRQATSARLQQMLDQASAADRPLMIKEAANILSRSKVVAEQLESTFENFTQVGWQPDTNNKLERQLHLVARLIEARESLGMERQLFFVQMGGWDTHSNQNERFPLLTRELNSAVSNFQSALETMNVANSVTTFTASDFGRTLTSNGNGTDHGWGGHNFVFGGAVSGGAIYGPMPSYANQDNPNDAGDRDGQFAGRIIPTQSVGQYGATLASWMGVENNALENIFPDLSNFADKNLGFMA